MEKYKYNGVHSLKKVFDKTSITNYLLGYEFCFFTVFPIIQTLDKCINKIFYPTLINVNRLLMSIRDEYISYFNNTIKCTRTTIEHNDKAMCKVFLE